MEESICFASGTLRIAGMIATASPTRAAIITHPHPLYGGDMDNPVVTALQRAYRRQGFSTLRFNFRGVGESEGRYDNGPGERQDVAAALALLADQGMTAIDLAGYSFGSWVNSGLSTGFQRMLMVSPPVAFMSFGPPAPIPALHLIVTGGRDDIAPAHMVSTYKNQWNPAAAFEVLPGADHFYTGFTKTLEDTIAAHI
jgi:alpha/beta superfamily hydrolase